MIFPLYLKTTFIKYHGKNIFCEHKWLFCFLQLFFNNIVVPGEGGHAALASFLD